MADYNIYVHAVGTGSATSQNPTIPWSQREEGVGGAAAQTTSQSGGGFGNGSVAFMSMARYAQNPDSLVSTGMSTLAKLVPALAVAAIVVKTADKLITEVEEINAAETGDHRRIVAYQNFKSRVSSVFTPVSTGVNFLKTINQRSREDSKRALQRDLLGDSVINSYTNRGV